jgi:outer membrane lipoprotein-sorting protein
VNKVLAILLTIVILTMCFLVTACEEELPTSEEIIEKLVGVQADVKSYEMEGNMDMKMVLDIPEEEMAGVPANVDVLVDINGAFDANDEEMMMAMDIDLGMAEEATIKMAAEFYLIDDWMYVMIDAPMMNPQWMKTEVSYSEAFEEMISMDFTQTQTEFLQSSDIVVTGKETLDGIECYVLEVSPDMSKLWEILMQQSQLASGAMAEMPVDEFEEIMDKIEDLVKDVSAKYWIAKDTYYIVKGEVAFNMVITPEAMGEPDEEGSVTMDVTMAMKMFNYGQPVSIVLPPEAEDAVEESMW